MNSCICIENLIIIWKIMIIGLRVNKSETFIRSRVIFELNKLHWLYFQQCFKLWHFAKYPNDVLFKQYMKMIENMSPLIFHIGTPVALWKNTHLFHTVLQKFNKIVQEKTVRLFITFTCSFFPQCFHQELILRRLTLTCFISKITLS